MSTWQTFTATFTAYGKYGGGSEAQATGVFYKTGAPPGYPHSVLARGVASMPAEGGVAMRTVTFVDGTAVIQHHLGRNATHDGVLTYTACPLPGTHPSLLNVAAALDTATPIDEAAMVRLVGGGPCEGGPDMRRFLVTVAGQPFVVCWGDDPMNVVVTNSEFFARASRGHRAARSRRMPLLLPLTACRSQPPRPLSCRVYVRQVCLYRSRCPRTWQPPLCCQQQ